MNILEPLAFKRKFRWGFEILQEGKIFIPFRFVIVDVKNYEFNSDKLKLGQWIIDDVFETGKVDTIFWDGMRKIYESWENKTDLNLVGNLILCDGCGAEVKRYVFEGLKIIDLTFGNSWTEVELSSNFSFSKVDCIISENNTTIFP
jgi:hypothetical protein